ncbi:CGNR zinc finger domain-containing protein [Streptomyces sp. NRRL F-5650]|uniref:CGNR zinc finger domain-containing protein n=1 Tax=Streptomyces sp. NRRL F-5650 TaxID=1463868 RepID=UPI00068F9095|nr:CGNR zinc finger domain-containing protein [Streptomyces sp. NRRL F-5650]
MTSSAEQSRPPGTADAPAFRLDNDQLAFRFTATLSDRYGSSVERLPDARRLDDWLAANALTIGPELATAADLGLALRLREAIHRAGSAIAQGASPEDVDRELINRVAGEERAFPELTPDGLRWHAPPGSHVRGALGLVARDAITVLGGERRAHVKTCESPECRGLYVDTSQAQNRRWCSMSICGNRAKKATFRAARRAAPAG